jgi:hypothetical protein
MFVLLFQQDCGVTSRIVLKYFLDASMGEKEDPEADVIGGEERSSIYRREGRCHLGRG